MGHALSNCFLWFSCLGTVAACTSIVHFGFAAHYFGATLTVLEQRLHIHGGAGTVVGMLAGKGTGAACAQTLFQGGGFRGRGP
jgi:hypothetical protein